LRDMRPADEAWRHHQPSAARRSHGLYPFAGQYLDRAVAEGQAAAEAGALGIYGERGEVVSHKKGGPGRIRGSTGSLRMHALRRSLLPSLPVEPRSSPLSSDARQVTHSCNLPSDNIARSQLYWLRWA